MAVRKEYQYLHLEKSNLYYTRGNSSSWLALLFTSKIILDSVNIHYYSLMLNAIIWNVFIASHPHKIYTEINIFSSCWSTNRYQLISNKKFTCNIRDLNYFGEVLPRATKMRLSRWPPPKDEKNYKPPLKCVSSTIRNVPRHSNYTKAHGMKNWKN